ncbi:hypothetical protein SK128_020994 [Halocaridina rubra]|uniref:Uncharacterized protein n=1 Tax=Halocaridina rubra TaxID=373956 RepID=A0AAN8XAL6_HALRR
MAANGETSTIAVYNTSGWHIVDPSFSCYNEKIISIKKHSKGVLPTSNQMQASLTDKGSASSAYLSYGYEKEHKQAGVSYWPGRNK